jgi:hypothetical protein
MELQQIAPTAQIAEVEMSVEAYTAAVIAAANAIQTGINGIWTLGQRAVKAAYGGSVHAPAMVLALLNNLPADAARQTFDWLKKAGLTVNRPQVGSTLYWLSTKPAKVNDVDVELITAKKPGDEGFGLAKEKAIEYVKTTPPMALVRKETKARAPKVLVGAAKNRAREAVVKTLKRLQKEDPDAARELNDFVSTVDDLNSCLYDAQGQRMKLEATEMLLVRRLLKVIDEQSVPIATLDAVLSGDVEIEIKAAA